MNVNTSTGDSTTGDERRFIAFSLAGGVHALPVEAVREVLGMVLITPLPDAPEWLTGAINMRGQIVPVIDLRVRVGVEAAALELSTPIVVVDHGGCPIGLIADSIEQILTVPQASIQEPDDLMRHSRLVKSVVRHGSRLIVVVDLDTVCAGTEQFTEPAA